MDLLFHHIPGFENTPETLVQCRVKRSYDKKRIGIFAILTENIRMIRNFLLFLKNSKVDSEEIVEIFPNSSSFSIDFFHMRIKRSIKACFKACERAMFTDRENLISLMM